MTTTTAPRVSPAGKRLLRAAVNRIARLRIHQRFNMMAWIETHHPCGTVACLGGYVLLEAGVPQSACTNWDMQFSKTDMKRLPPRLQRHVRQERSRSGPSIGYSTLLHRVLGDHALRLDIDALTLLDRWPEPLRFTYREAASHRGRVAVLRRRLEHWLATGE